MNSARFVKYLSILVVILVVILAGGLSTGSMTLLTPDQQAYRDFQQEVYSSAAAKFADPMWRGVSLFKAREYEQAAAIFSAFDTPEAVFNQGNALVMQGKYFEAVERYNRALVLRPGWEDAINNRDIAAGRGEALELEGGDMTGGMLGADDFVFSDSSSSPSSGEQESAAPVERNESEIRASWLRKVQTRPADFLRSKFAYQYATAPQGQQNTGQAGGVNE